MLTIFINMIITITIITFICFFSLDKKKSFKVENKKILLLIPSDVLK